MPRGLRPARLARGAQGFGEAFRHDVGSHLGFGQRLNDAKGTACGKPAENEAARLMELAAERKIVVWAHIALDFPGKGSIAVCVDGLPPGSRCRRRPRWNRSATPASAKWSWRHAAAPGCR